MHGERDNFSPMGPVVPRLIYATKQFSEQRRLTGRCVRNNYAVRRLRVSLRKVMVTYAFVSPAGTVVSSAR